jgi:hypothetical protein
MFDKIKKPFVEIFDKNNNGHLHFSEIYPLFLIFALLTLFLIISKNLDILIIFKKSRWFIVLFIFLLLYSIFSIINYNQTYNSKNPATLDENFYYILSILNLLFCAFCILYLTGLFYLV